MATLLHIETSPRKERSSSSRIASAFIDAYAARNPHDTIDTMDVWSMRLPEFDGDALEAKYAALGGVERSPQQDAAWSEIAAIAGRVRSADKLLLSVPMWNFGIPYKFKHLIDAISQKDLLFTFTEAGFTGLVSHAKATVVYARGIDYAPTTTFATPAAEWDQQRPYVELWLRFIGVTDIASIVAERTLMGAESSEASIRQASDEARAIAERF
ncbi:MAG: NAD(P)H-dependent oxidoreductase [Vulcanimicrobiaceae bacterium]